MGLADSSVVTRESVKYRQIKLVVSSADLADNGSSDTLGQYLLGKKPVITLSDEIML